MKALIGIIAHDDMLHFLYHKILIMRQILYRNYLDKLAQQNGKIKGKVATRVEPVMHFHDTVIWQGIC